MSLQMADSTEDGVIENVEWLRNTGSNSASYSYIKSWIIISYMPYKLNI